MAEAGKKISAYPILSAPSANTKLVVEHNGNTYSISIINVFANVTGNVSVSNTSTFSVNNFIIRRGDTPANSTPTVSQGTIWFDADYLYVATANNTLKRVALTAF
jgi:hypothetical protein